MTQSSQEFIADPTHHLLAVIDEWSDAEDAAQVLEEAGFEEVRLYRGSAGARAMDASGDEHGFGEFVVRLVQQALTNKDSLAEYEGAIERGAAVVSVLVDGDGDDEARRDEAVNILEMQNAHRINYFGQALVHTIKP